MVRGLLEVRWVRWVAFVTWVVVATVGGLEVVLRVAADWNPGYYMAFRDMQPGVVRYPWGEVPVNAQGWPDTPVGRKHLPRVGWVGDSVLYGVGAGFGNRITEVMDDLRPDLEHLNLGALGFPGIEDDDARILSLVDALQLDHVVYVMNLNDVRLDVDPTYRNGGPGRLPGAFLEGRSYLYSAASEAWTRWQIWSAPKWQPVELAPATNRAAFEATIRRTRAAAAALRARGARFSAVILPYEMQVSAGAADSYRELGVVWEEGFELGSAQHVLVEGLAGLTVVDALEAFVGIGDERPRRRADNPRCRYFVCDRSGRLDWNHLTPEGHRKVATFVHEIGLLNE